MPSRSVARVLAVLAMASAVSWLGCGGGSDIAGPEPGSLDVTTATTGPEPDVDGYTLSIDGAAPVAIAVNASRHTEGMVAGQHTVALAGLAGNCTVATGVGVTIEVLAGAAAAVRFEVACAATSGTIEVVTTSAGSPPDPDGYQLLLDGAPAQAIGASATVSIPGTAPGPHTVGLGGLAANCSLDGDNPRAVTVSPGAVAPVAFTIACTALPPTTGSIAITTATTGPAQDPDGYAFTIDQGGAQPVGVNGTVSVAGLPAGSHAVRLQGAAANCTIGAANPRTIAVVAGGTATTTFAVTCTATTGALAVTVTGLPAGTSAAVTVTGPNGFTRAVTATANLTDLAPGSYTVAAADVANGASTYTPSPKSRVVPVAAGATASAAVSYAAVVPSLNLRIDGWFITQSVQSAAGDVPLVQNRDGFVRVFVLADGPNTATPRVRLSMYLNGTLARTFDIPAPGPSTPQSRDENDLASSWNVKIPRELFGPGLTVLAEVDPANAIAEKNESDNRYPVSGTAETETMRNVPPLGVTLVPVKQQTSGLTGDVSAANRATYLSLPRRMLPISTGDDDVHQVYTTTTPDPLLPGDDNGAWLTILAEIDALRVAEGTTRNYYGVVQLDYASGIAGLGYVGQPTAMGYDRVDDRSRVMAHEMGHNFGRQHSPCGTTSGLDPNYPYFGGLTGAYGFDLQANVLKSPLLADIMGYCANPWISDYTYEGMLTFRTAGQAAIAAAARTTPQRCLLVWGRIVDGRAVLEPAFEIVTRPSLPKSQAPYRVEAATEDGARLFSLSFDASEIADSRRGARQFAFAVPLGGVSGDRVGSLRLSGPGGEAAAVRAPVAAGPLAAARAAGTAVEARVVAGGIALRWDAAARPMVMVRDPDTGEVLSFARGGQVNVATSKRTLDVVVSDRVGSRQVRVTAGR
jgi:peptidase M66-like protein